MNRIGIDIGGTSIKFALISEESSIILRAQKPTQTGDPAAVAETISELVRENCADWKRIPIGVACAGDVDPVSGLVTADNLGWNEVPLGELLKEKLSCSPLLEQDTHAAMMAEWEAGSLRGEKNAVYLTLGTGVGGGIIIDGRPYREIKRQGSEIGHMITHAGGELCPCGEHGCYERYASASALVRRAEEYHSAHDIFDAVMAGDTKILPIWRDYIREVCIGLISLLVIFTPDAISIGGGISGSGAPFLDAIMSELEKHPYYQRYGRSTKILLAQFGNDAGVLGAASAACRVFERGKNH